MLDRIKVCFTESIQTQIAAAEALPDAISRAAIMLVHSLLNGNKILCCGNGASAATAQRLLPVWCIVLKQSARAYQL